MNLLTNSNSVQNKQDGSSSNNDNINNANANQVSNPQSITGGNSAMNKPLGLTKSFSSNNNENNQKDFLNKPVNIPSLKQKLYVQKKAPMKLFSQNVTAHIDLYEANKKTNTKNSTMNQGNSSSGNKVFGNMNRSCFSFNSNTGKAKSYSTMSWDISDRETKVHNISDKKANSNSMSNAKFFEGEKTNSSELHKEKNPFELINTESHKKAFNLKSKSLIKKKQNKNLDIIKIEGMDELNQYVRDNMDGSDSVTIKVTSPNNSNLFRSSSSYYKQKIEKQQANNFYCINVYLNK